MDPKYSLITGAVWEGYSQVGTASAEGSRWRVLIVGFEELLNPRDTGVRGYIGVSCELYGPIQPLEARL